MNKKILMGLGAVLAVVAGVAALSAYEAHVVNVIAKIENALTVQGEELSFGTVFPQEMAYLKFRVDLSESFLAQSRLADVNYRIVQKPKPIWPLPGDCTSGATSTEAARAYCHDSPTDYACCYRDLCRFLSKIPASPDGGDEGHPSYYHEDTAGDFCTSSAVVAHGNLNKLTGDTKDMWGIDLKVPPVTGYVGQDWPATCLDWVVPANDKDYGCDLWIEVTSFSTSTPA